MATKKAVKIPPGVARGDHVYATHPKHGPMAFKVLSTGKDGFVGECDGQRHPMEWPSFLGHKARMLHHYEVVDQGADGALLQEPGGQRRFVSGGHLPIPEEEDATDAKPNAEKPDDPLTGGLGRLTKADALSLEPGFDKNGHAIHRWKGERESVFPQPQRMMDAADPAYAPGGRYLAMPSKRDITGRTVARARISIQGDGKPAFDVSSDEGEPHTPAHGNMVRANLFKQKAGWKWASRNDGVPAAETVVSVEHGNKHHYALAADFPHGVTLARYADAPSEPRLRPTTRGHVVLGRVVGSINVRGREHPVHDNIAIHRSGVSMSKALHRADLLPVAMNEDTDMVAPIPVLFLKAGSIANRPGLSLKESTDKSGRNAKHWVRTQKDAPKVRQPGAVGAAAPGRPGAAPDAGARPAPMKHGDMVNFRHGDVQGTGKIVASGQDGVTVHDGEREHQVRHDALEGKAHETHDGAPPPNPKPLFTPDEMAHLPTKAKQPFTDQASLYKASTEALGELKGWLNQGNGICSKLGYETMGKGMDGVDWSKPGGMLFIAPLKGEKRAKEKVDADYGGDWSQLKDVVRCSIAVDTMDDINDVLDALKAGGMELAQQPKDRFNKPLPEGYRDLMLSVKFKNGAIGEVQVHLKAMLEAKELGHKPYEVMRTIDAKPREQWSDQDKQAWQKAFDDSTAIYGKAWNKAAGAAGAPDERKDTSPPMSKAMGMGGGVATWEFREREGAQFRRPKGQPGGVTDVLHDGQWKPYTGDRTAAYLYSDECQDPVGGGQDGGDPPMAKALLFISKAIIPGGASHDLFAAPVMVAGYVRDGKAIAPHVAIRHKAPTPTPQPAPVKATPSESASDTRMRRLSALQNRATRYEAVVHHPDARAELDKIVADAGGIPDLGPSERAKRYRDGMAAPVSDMKHFYVSAVDGTKKHLVAGPYDSHDEAKSRVEEARRHAESDPRAHFMAWGTAGSAMPQKTPLGAGWKAPTQPPARRKVTVDAQGETWLETSPGSGEHKQVTEPHGVWPWRQDGDYHLSDVAKLFKTEAGADKYANKIGESHVARTVKYVKRA